MLTITYLAYFCYKYLICILVCIDPPHLLFAQLNAIQTRAMHFYLQNGFLDINYIMNNMIWSSFCYNSLKISIWHFFEPQPIYLSRCGGVPGIFKRDPQFYFDLLCVLMSKQVSTKVPAIWSRILTNFPLLFRLKMHLGANQFSWNYSK